MTTAFLKSTAAAALVMLSLGAQAAPVTLNFENLGASARSTTAPYGSPAVAINNFGFGGAFAYQFSSLDTSPLGGDTKPSSPSLDGQATDNGFIMNRARALTGTTAPGNIELTFTGANAGRFLKSLQVDLFVNSLNSAFIEFYAGSTLFDIPILTKGDGAASWSRSSALTFGDQTHIDRIVFGVRETGGVVGLDNLNLDFHAAGDGGNGTVPEPASYALVALALLAAGGASRRRKA